MSRVAGQVIAVVTARDGTPALVGGVEVLHVYSRHREWIGVLEGAPEVDVWRVEVPRGIVELHHLRAEKTWQLARWED